MTIDRKKLFISIIFAMLLSVSLCLFSVRAEQETEADPASVETEVETDGTAEETEDAAEEEEATTPQAETPAAAEPDVASAIAPNEVSDAVSAEPAAAPTPEQKTESETEKAADTVLNGLCYDPADGKTLRFYKNGKVDNSYTGFAVLHAGEEGAEDRWFYVEAGTVSGKRNDVIYGTVAGSAGWYLVRKSEFTRSTTVAQNSNGWWYVQDGKVDFGYHGFANNDYGRWYLQNGKVTFQYTGFAKDAEGWWYVSGSYMDAGRHDIIYGRAALNPGDKTSDAWWYVKNGKVSGEETVEQNQNGWWYVKDGKVNFRYNGFARNGYGWWYLENGGGNFPEK